MSGAPVATLATAATLGPSAYWYLARGTGAVSLILLTVSMVLGVIDWGRVAFAPRWPRFAIDSLHRDVSLVVVLVLVVHILTSVLDGFAPIRLTDGLIPFISRYRPLWLGFGTLSFDLLLAIAATSLLRRRIGFRAWRWVHWLAYASWPVAVLHGLGSGSDTRAWWMLALTAVCVAAVVAAAAVRIARSERPAWQRPAAALAAVTPVGLAAFTAVGPLQSGWAGRAGTPANLLSGSTAARGTGSTGTRDRLKAPFSGALAGTVTQSQTAGGSIVDLRLRVTGGAQGDLRVRMAGAPGGSAGLTMTGSQVDFTAIGLASVLEGRILSVQGNDLLARVRDTSGAVVDLRADLKIDNQTGSVTGTLSATPGGATR